MNIGADGMKTGYTREAGYGLVASAEQNGLRLILAVNGFKEPKERADESRKILEWGFKGFESKVLFAEGQTVGEARLFGGAQRYVPVMGEGVIRLMVQKNTNDKINARIVYRGPVRAPVEKGQSVGVLKVFRGDSVALEVPLVATESVGTGSMPRRAIDAVGELVVGLFRAGIERL
jgi:D-alanyl-D-alanine carboxypeptidase (penicillin-binding protein 5/6)